MCVLCLDVEITLSYCYLIKKIKQIGDTSVTIILLF